MIISLKTELPFRARTETHTGEILKVRDGQGRLVETWECISAKAGKVTFDADGYQSTSDI